VAQTFTFSSGVKPLVSDPRSNSSGPVTIREVAAQAGVSTATVSRALAGLDGVGKEVRDRVTQAVAKLNYRPNRLARSLRLGHRKLIGVVIPDLQNPFFTGVVHGVEAELYNAGYTLLLGNSDGLAAREKEQLETLRGEGVAGLVFIPGNQPTANDETIQSWGIPVVAVDRSPGERPVDLVCASNREGMRKESMSRASASAAISTPSKVPGLPRANRSLSTAISGSRAVMPRWHDFWTCRSRPGLWRSPITL